MSVPQALYVIAILHATYLMHLCGRQPSNKVISTQSESWLLWKAAAPGNVTPMRLFILVLVMYHSVVSLALPEALPHSTALLRSTCPTPQYLDSNIFSWSPQVVVSLLLLYIGSYIRLRAFAQLGENFTFRLATPDTLVTDGMYAYVRHPSYTGMILALVGMHSLFFRQRGLVSCWVPMLSEKLVTDDRIGYLGLAVVLGFFLGLVVPKRVEDEEKMMEKEFGERWREHCRRTKKFVPWLY